VQLNEVIGLDQVKHQLLQMHSNDRLPHAMLFLGGAGSSKLVLALALAQFLLCENKQDGESCGTCKSCSKASKFVHPDLHFSFPTVGSKEKSETFLAKWRTAITQNPYLNANDWLQIIEAENKQGNITKEECVSIIKKLSLKAFEGLHKILVMWLPEHLGNEGNRLLKMIEEPPADTVFILVAENQNLILNTILSRCQIIKIPSFQDEEILNNLVTKGLPSEKAASIAHLANGNYNEALKMMSNAQNDNAALFVKWLRSCYRGHGVELVEQANELATLGREKQKFFFRYALHFLREYMVIMMTGNQNARLQQGELATAIKLTSIISFEQVNRLVQLFDDCTFHIERNAHPKVLFLDAGIQINKILKNR